jgi:hypothetical protein
VKTIIAGGRNIIDRQWVDLAVEQSQFEITEVVSGTARGADTLGEEWAARNNVPVKRFPAEWDRLGKSAGYKRNQTMATYAEALILVWDGDSKGSGHMLAIAKALNLKVYELKVELPPTPNESDYVQPKGL